jgi:protein-L-isoaspartate(D-aspartate) O-methyltransferase
MTRPIPEELAAARAVMVKTVADEVLWTNRYLGKTALDKRVIEALGRVPRHDFAPDDLMEYAYENRPLPIGQGQTISQPYIVAVMTDMLNPQPRHRVLEIGTGCGYQAAILSLLVARVYTIETVPELAQQSAKRLKRLGYANVEVREGDGNLGWPEAAPFDGIIVTAAAPDVPQALIDQLAPGGRMAIPIGPRGGEQALVLVRKEEGGGIDRRELLPVAFVPLVKGG